MRKRDNAVSGTTLSIHDDIHEWKYPVLQAQRETCCLDKSYIYIYIYIYIYTYIYCDSLEAIMFYQYI